MTKTPDIEFHDSKCLYRINIEGYIAHGKDKQPEDCPFANGPEYDAWMDGYITADCQESGDFD